MSALLVILPLALVLVAVQATLMQPFSLAGGHPDIVLVGLALLAIQFGRESTIIPALIIAPFYDAASGFPIGTSILPFAAVVYLAGIGERTLFGARLGWPMFLAFIATIVAGLITAAELALMGWTLPWTATVLRVVLPSALLNAVLMLLMYLPTEYLRERRAAQLR